MVINANLVIYAVNEHRYHARAKGWLEHTLTGSETVAVGHPGPRHEQILRQLLMPLGTGGNLTSDAHLAAMAIENNAEVWSFDSDFARFAGVKWRNPIG